MADGIGQSEPDDGPLPGDKGYDTPENNSSSGGGKMKKTAEALALLGAGKPYGDNQ